jgi:hypothetical protein
VTDVRVASTQTGDVEGAVAEIRRALGGAMPRVIVYFASPSYPPSDVAAAMERAFAPATVLGATTAGEIISGRLLKRSIVAMALPAEVVQDLSVQVLTDLDALDRSMSAAIAAIDGHYGVPVRELDPTTHIGLVLCDGLSHREERVMDALASRTDLLFVGGSAGDDLAFETTHVFADGEAYTSAALVAVLRVRGFSALKTQSFVPTGKRLQATRVVESERLVLEFDGHPAALAYAEALGVDRGELPHRFPHNPLGLMDGDTPFVRSPREVSGDAVLFYCAIREGMELEVLASSDIVQDTRQALQSALHELGTVSSILTFNCVLRTLELEKRGECGAYGELFADVPTVGFSTYGEAYIGHVNQTATMLLLR